MDARPRATNEWRGRFLEDFEVGQFFRSRLGRTISEADNTWFTLLIVLGLSVADTSENAVANLGWEQIRLPRPVFAGDTLWAESEVLSVRESRSRPGCGIIEVRTRGVNQRGEVILEFRR